jgi:hypothetical protein
MKKIIISLASLLAAIAFAPESSAMPLFARQTGMACNACHYQHFPLLSAFGRAFKASGFTLMGAQGLIEGEGLSIPNTLNMTVLTTAGYAKSNGSDTAAHQGVASAGVKTLNDGAVYVPGTNGEFSLFVGGRISENAGFMAEIGAIGPVNLGSAKMPILFQVTDNVRAGVVLFTTDGQGASYGYELLNTGANAVHQMSGTPGFDDSHTKSVSAQQYIGTNAPATGASIVVNSDKGFINLARFHQAGPADLGGTGAELASTYLRIATIFDIHNWDAAVGIQSWSGSSMSPTGTPEVAAVDATQLSIVPYTYTAEIPAVPATFGLVTTKATAIDAQLQGDLNGKPFGLYVTYATAPSTTVANAYNGGSLTRSSFNIAGEIGVIPEKATLGAAVRFGKSGVADTEGSNETDNAISLIGTYKIAQNMLGSVSVTKQSGSYWSSTGEGTTSGKGNSTITINLFTLF